MLDTKLCTRCGKCLPYIAFGLDKKAKCGLNAWCKVCVNMASTVYQRTKRGVATTIYTGQNKTSRKRGHPSPTYTKEEFIEWLFSQPAFHILYDNWKGLDYQKMYKPSVDRKDDYIGYTMANIQLTSWGKNKSRYHQDAKDGINNKQNKAIIQFTKEREYINTYYSLSEASRNTNISVSFISAVCRGAKQSAGGFKWEFKKGKKC